MKHETQRPRVSSPELSASLRVVATQWVRSATRNRKRQNRGCCSGAAAKTMRGSSDRKAVSKALASGKSARKASAKKKGAKPWNASWAACGDGCLDKLVVSVKKEPPTTRPLRGGLVEFPDVPTASSAGRSSAGVSGGSGGSGGSGVPLVPLVLLGLLSGSPTRRAMLRCTWMQVPRFHESVRLIFVVGSNAPGPGQGQG